jgi:hypothetical protein
MKAIGWLLIFIGIGAAIDAFHGNSPYQSLVSYLEGNGAIPAGGTASNLPTAQDVLNAGGSMQQAIATAQANNTSDAGTIGETAATLPQRYIQFPGGQGPGVSGH